MLNTNVVSSLAQKLFSHVVAMWLWHVVKCGLQSMQSISLGLYYPVAVYKRCDSVIAIQYKCEFEFDVSVS